MSSIHPQSLQRAPDPREPEGASAEAERDLSAPDLYINRELSQLHFNARVLAQSRDSGTPLLERLRFLTICSSNLDEFFEIRVAGLKQRAAHGSARGGADGMTPAEALQQVGLEAQRLVEEQYRVLNETLLPALEEERIRVHRRDRWTDPQRAWLAQYFSEQILPVLSPVALDPGHPFPRILNKALHFAVALQGEDAFGRTAGLAIVPVPRCLPRLIALPGRDGDADFVLLSSVIHAHMQELFLGMDVLGAHQFRVTRNSDLWVDEEEVEDLLDALKGELPSRRYSDAVRLEVADNCPPATAELLLRQVDLGPDDLYRVRGPVNLHRLSELVDEVDRPDLRYPALVQGLPARRTQGTSIFDDLRSQDILLHHPYESFAPVLELLTEAARDPEVLAIKQTLYRTGRDSPVVARLIEAAQAGKEVTAVVELRARFDEAANIQAATRLQEVGVNVVYGIVGFKAHAKLLLVVRREEGGRLQRYAHLGTGNYHSDNVRQYSDFGLLTSHSTICRDVHSVFMQLTSVGHQQPLAELHQSPFTLKPELLRRIHEERKEAATGRPARIQARMNALSDPEVIHALYEASQAGVSIDLVVRGVCCLRPGLPGVSENIRVRSIVGRFLEHTRAWRFGLGERECCFLTSADWMPRNLHRRVEVVFPVLDPELAGRVVDESLLAYLGDDAQAWLLDSSGAWTRPPVASTPTSAQELLLARLSLS